MTWCMAIEGIISCLFITLDQTCEISVNICPVIEGINVRIDRYWLFTFVVHEFDYHVIGCIAEENNLNVCCHRCNFMNPKGVRHAIEIADGDITAGQSQKSSEGDDIAIVTKTECGTVSIG